MNIMPSIMTYLKNNRASIIVTLVFLVYTLFSFGFYLERTLNGDINSHILSSEMFGVPQALNERGIKPLYYGPGQTGWDGQFYYYMSNDILALKDTAGHIDAPSYRYQRIGLSLYTAIVAKILGMDWVSPSTFFVSYLVLILAATLTGAQLFSKLGAHPSLILFWSLSVGTQITLFNALPDAAADAFLILALSALFARNYALATIPFIFSALSREVYTLFPSFILLFLLIDLLFNSSISGKNWLHQASSLLFRWRSYYLLALPGLAAVLWLIYITKHLGVAPAEQAYGVIGYPLLSWWEHFLSGINGNHKLVGSGFPAYAEACSLLIFLLVLAVSLWISLFTVLKRYSQVSPELRGFAVALICFVLLYASFGRTVIMHYTGYIKAVAIFFFAIPLLIATSGTIGKKKFIVYMLLIISIVFTTFYNMKVKLLVIPEANLDLYTKMSSVTKSKRIDCLGEYHAKIKIDGIYLNKGSFMQKLFGRSDLLVLDLSLTNTGNSDFVSSKSSGGVYMSYQWVDVQGNVVVDGIRSAIPGVVVPGQTVKASIVSYLPANTGELYLKPSPVQEGCAWFYQSDPTVSDGIKIYLSN